MKLRKARWRGPAPELLGQPQALAHAPHTPRTPQVHVLKNSSPRPAGTEA